MITDILDVSVIEAGNLELHEEPTVISEIVDASIRLVQQRADQEDVRLVNRISGTDQTIYADGRRIKQILVNLLSNAVKFTPRNDQVNLDAGHHQDGCFILSVSDTGLGMDEIGMNKAMEMFGQVENQLSSNQRGAGLGLPLSKSLIEAHGGKIEVESEPGTGTTVSICFPENRLIQ
ncbi:MAG: HAMP domain-containing sensor histidine kinase [Rhodospirillales bacterium]|nr:HAMP domain-containing sensor histidine kinase [Rhodospirillales bacterium]